MGNRPEWPLRPTIDKIPARASAFFSAVPRPGDQPIMARYPCASGRHPKKKLVFFPFFHFILPVCETAPSWTAAGDMGYVAAAASMAAISETLRQKKKGLFMSMSREEIREKVIDITCDQLQVSRDQVKDESAFVEDLGADSLDIAELVMEFEDEFDLEIPEDEQGIRTIKAAVDFISDKVNK
jgi:acyl carrier protein